MVDMDWLLCGRLSTECHIYLVGGEQGNVHVESLVVCIVGKMAQDVGMVWNGVKVLWCHSHLVWLVFEGPIPTCACFHSKNFV